MNNGKEVIVLVIHVRSVTITNRRRSRGIARGGFTMVDLVITMMITGILAAVAAPKFADTLQRFRAESAAQRIKTDLEFARQNAMSKSTTQIVQFTPATDSYTLSGMADLDRSSQTYSVDLAAAPYHAVLVSATLGSDSDLQFDFYGQPDSGGTITVQSGSFQQTVTVDADTGKATVP